VEVCCLSDSTLNYDAAVWGAESRAIKGPKDGEFWRGEGERSSHLHSCWKSFINGYKRKVLTDVLPQVWDRLGQKEVLHEFQEKLLISDCRCNLQS